MPTYSNGQSAPGSSSPRASQTAPIWQPDAQRIERAGLTRFQRWLKEERNLAFADYESLWRWSVEDLEGFWGNIWDYFDIDASTPYERVLGRRDMPHASWFEGARLNYAQHLLRRARQPDAGQRPALVFRSERESRREVTWATLSRQCAGVMSALRSVGVAPGDRVGSYMPNIPETVAAMLATTGVGAIWSSCSPDMGVTGVLDRFRQIEPRVLFVVDGYNYGGKPFDRRETIVEMVKGLPSVRAVILVSYLDADSDLALPGVPVLSWADMTRDNTDPSFEPVAFDHPLWIVYSSGTTGMPKPIVHGHGGSLLESLKANALHLDVGADDRFFWFSSTSWIMWNLWASTLANGCTALHYDGNPGYPDLSTLWSFAAQEKATFFGTSPAFISLNQKAGLRPGEQFDLGALRTVGSTGSPLTDNQYEWIYDAVSPNVLLASISGGTDPGAAFLTASPTLPVYAGEMQCRSLGCAVYSFSDTGERQTGEVGELVVTEPMPSMPLYFWGDDDGSRYFNSYFDTWPGCWRHGDWLELRERPESVTSVIYGRSDSTINRHGIRMGTSELYRVVEGLDWVMDSLVVDLEYLGRPSEMLLFVVTRDASPVSAAQSDEVRQLVRSELSARHVPDQVISIAEVPRTMSGKKLEVPVKRLLLDQPVDRVVNRDAMANPGSIDWFIQFHRERSAASS